jgi:hypothetical protein
MVDVLFQRMDEVVTIRLDGNNILFSSSQYGAGIYPIESLKLNYQGAIKENPDLVDDAEWSSKSIERLKMKVKEFKTEEKRIDYLVSEMKPFGYIPIALLIWSRVQNQMMLDTMREIRDFFTESFGTSKEKIEEVIKQ